MFFDCQVPGTLEFIANSNEVFVGNNGPLLYQLRVASISLELSINLLCSLQRIYVIIKFFLKVCVFPVLSKSWSNLNLAC